MEEKMKELGGDGLKEHLDEIADTIAGMSPAERETFRKEIGKLCDSLKEDHPPAQQTEATVAAIDKGCLPGMESTP